MPLNFHCPSCGRPLSAPDGAYSTQGSCIYCGAAIISPASAEEAAQLAGPPTGAATEAPVYLGPGPLSAGAVINETYELTRKHWVTLLGAGMLVLIIPQAASFAAQMLTIMPSLWVEPNAEPGVIQTIAYFVTIVLIMLVTFPLQAGLLYLSDAILMGRPPEFSLVFRGFRRAGSIIGVNLLMYLIVMAIVALPFGLMVLLMGTDSPFWGPEFGGASALTITLFFVVFTIVIVLGTFLYIQLMFAVPEIVDKDTPALEALGVSWRITEGHRWHVVGIYFLFSLLFIPAYIIGLLMLCIGVMVTLPLMTAAMMLGQMIVYRQLRGLQGTSY